MCGERQGMKDENRTTADPIEVSTGEVKTSTDGLLRASALGSCVAVAMLDAAASVGGLAHVMLPGASSDGQETEHTKYAHDGIRELADAMVASGARPERLVACLVGGGNVLGRDDDTICEANIASVTRTLEEMQIAVAARELGGTERRSVSLDVEAAKIICTVGDSGPKLLWEPDGTQSGDNKS